MMADAPIILFGIVIDTKDPDDLGRVKVKLTSHGTALEIPWLRVLQPIASNSAGVFLLPEVDDEVAILRGAGNHLDGMVVLGAVYNAKAKPKNPDSEGKNNLKQIITRGGTEITIDDTDGSELFTLKMKDEKLSLVFDRSAGEITLTGDAKITIKATTDVLIDCKNAEIKASGNVDVKASQNVTIEGTSKVEVKATAALTLASSGAKLDGGGKLDLVGGTINIG